VTPTIARRELHGVLLNTVAPLDLGASVNGVRVGRGPHLEPGVVAYDREDGSKITYLLPREAIERGRPTAKGKPLVGKSGGFDHVKVDPKKLSAGGYDGAAVESYPLGDGYEWLLFQVKDDETADACQNGHQFSCAYIPTDVEEKPGVWHNVPYDAVIKDLEYTHFAVVPNPRYDAAQDGKRIEILNSIPRKGGLVNEALKKVLIAVVGKEGLLELVNSFDADDKTKALDEKKNAMRAEAKNAFDAAMKNAGADAAKQTEAKNAYEKLNAEIDAMNADPAAVAETPEQKATREKTAKVKELRDAADALEKDLGAKPALGGGDVQHDPGMGQPGGAKPQATNAETPEQKAAREKDAADKAALEKKNADEAAAKKAADEEAEKKRRESEHQNAVKAAAAKAAKEAREEVLRNSNFQKLRALAEERTSSAVAVGFQTMSDKADLGRKAYGSSN
jgi:Uncharacterized protein conserved in bacteria (DUF2213)